MRVRLASIVAGATVFFLALLFFIPSPEIFNSLWKSEDTTIGHYPYVKPSPLPWHPPKPKEAADGSPAKRFIVKIKLESEDTSWIQELTPEWSYETIAISRGFTSLRSNEQTVDKGRIASTYLTWLIEHYNNLPATIVFLPPNQQQQKQRYISATGLKPSNSKLQTSIPSLQIPFIQSSGFVNLHCPSPAICADLILPFRSPPNEFRTLEVAMPKVWKDLFNNTNVPDQLATPPGAEFAVSKAQVQRRSVNEYLTYWKWINRTKMDDDTAGLVFEYLWHVIFGKEAVFCPEEKTCKCQVYGMCGN